MRGDTKSYVDKTLSPTEKQFYALFGFNCVLKHCSRISKQYSRIMGKPKMEEAVESLRELSNPLPLAREGLWFSQFDEDHSSMTTIS